MDAFICPHCGKPIVDAAPDNSALGKVRQLFEQRPEWTAKEILAAIGNGHPVKTVRNAAAYLVRRGLVEKLGYGKYRSLKPQGGEE